MSPETTLEELVKLAEELEAMRPGTVVQGFLVGKLARLCIRQQHEIDQLCRADEAQDKLLQDHQEVHVDLAEDVEGLESTVGIHEHEPYVLEIGRLKARLEQTQEDVESIGSAVTNHEHPPPLNLATVS